MQALFGQRGVVGQQCGRHGHAKARMAKAAKSAAIASAPIETPRPEAAQIVRPAVATTARISARKWGRGMIVSFPANLGSGAANAKGQNENPGREGPGFVM
jgi:hypothetical protein